MKEKLTAITAMDALEDFVNVEDLAKKSMKQNH
jgi:hypothetical protein